MGHNERIRKERRRQRIIAVLIFVFVVCGGYLITYLYRQNALLPVTFLTEGKPPVQYALEIADTPTKRAKGLMFRKSLGAKGGMIFLSNEDTVQKFWMENTFVSLDMIFIDRDKRVVGVLESVPILNTEPRFVDVPSRYVIELPAGSARRDEIHVGTVVQFPDKK